METAIDPFNVQFDFGTEGVTEDNARYAEVWDGPIQVAILMRVDDEWVPEHVDTDYVEPHHMSDSYSTVGEFISFVHLELDA